MPLRTDCRKCKYAPAVVLIKAKLYCAKCAVEIHYPQYKDKDDKPNSTSKNNKQTTSTVRVPRTNRSLYI